MMQPKDEHPLSEEWATMDLSAQFRIQEMIASHDAHVFFIDYIKRHWHDPLRHCHYLSGLTNYYPAWAVEDRWKHKEYLSALDRSLDIYFKYEEIKMQGDRAYA